MIKSVNLLALFCKHSSDTIVCQARKVATRRRQWQERKS